MGTDTTNPYEILFEMDQLCNRMADAFPSQEKASEYWKGIGFRQADIAKNGYLLVSCLSLTNSHYICSTLRKFSHRHRNRANDSFGEGKVSDIVRRRL